MHSHFGGTGDPAPCQQATTQRGVAGLSPPGPLSAGPRFHSYPPVEETVAGGPPPSDLSLCFRQVPFRFLWGTFIIARKRVPGAPYLFGPCSAPFRPSGVRGGRVPIGRLCSNYPQLSLTRAPGILMWKAVRVLWSFRCEVVFQQARLTVNDCLRVLHSEVSKWLAMPDLSLDHEAVRMYAGALQGWLTDRNIPVCEGSDVAGQKRPCPSPQQPDRYFRRQTADTVSRKRARVAAEGLEDPHFLHTPEVYADGSFGPEAPRTGFAGFGVWFGPLDPRNMAEPLEGGLQTVNRAELSACIAALRVVLRGQALRVVTDSKYVYDGILKHLRRWRLQSRPFVNSDLWLQLRVGVYARTAPTLWRHVYSHIGVAGNERVDELPPRAGWHTPDGASSCATRRRQRAGHHWWSAWRVGLRSHCLLGLHQCRGWAEC